MCVCVCVCVCVYEREGVCVYVCMRDREKVCVCVWEREGSLPGSVKTPTRETHYVQEVCSVAKRSRSGAKIPQHKLQTLNLALQSLKLT